MSMDRKVKSFLSALEGGAADEDLAAFFHPDLYQEEFPGRFAPAGARRDRDAAVAEAALARRRFARQIFDLVTLTGFADRWAAEIRWSGELALPEGDGRPGDLIYGRIAIVFEFEDGLIIRQRLYPCIEPF
jgi:ketosteroid isomerase-like protein